MKCIGGAEFIWFDEFEFIEKRGEIYGSYVL
jgi:hypothetical protein